MKKVLDYFKRADIADIFQTVLVGALLLVLVYFNLFHISDTVDQDFASLLTHAVEMGDKHQFLLRNWDYHTTGEFDCGLLLAVFFYMFVKNIFVAYGLSNIVNIALWVFVLWTLFENVELGRKYRMLVLALIFSIYQFYSLSYTNLMFFAGSQYIYKTLIPLILATILLTPEEKRLKAKTIFLYVVMAILSVITGLSSGNYVLICGIFPIGVVLVVLTFAMGKDKNTIYRFVVYGCSIVLLLIGSVLCSALDIQPNSANVDITLGANVIETFAQVFDNMFSLMVFKSTETMAATSFAGIVYVLRFVVMVVVLFGLGSVVRAFGIGTLIARDSVKEISAKDILETFMISIFVWNYFILLVTIVEPRYHLIGLFPLFICAAIRLERAFSEKQDISRLFALCITICLIVINIGAVLIDARNFFNHVGVYYCINYDECQQIADLLEENNIHTAFIDEGNELNSSLRVVDKTRIYEMYHKDTGWVENIDYYWTETDRSAFDDRNAMISKADNLDEFPYFIANNYELIGKVHDKYIYMSETNPIDGGTMLIDDYDSIDLATTPGYTSIGDIDGNGYLTYDGGNEILKSPEIEIDRPIKWKLNYTLENNGQYACVVVNCNGESFGTYDIPIDSEELVIDIDNPGTYQFSILKYNDGKMQVREIKFEVVK